MWGTQSHVVPRPPPCRWPLATRLPSSTVRLSPPAPAPPTPPRRRGPRPLPIPVPSSPRCSPPAALCPPKACQGRPRLTWGKILPTWRPAPSCRSRRPLVRGSSSRFRCQTETPFVPFRFPPVSVSSSPHSRQRTQGGSRQRPGCRSWQRPHP